MLSQQLFNGLVVGATYAIFALGFTVMFGVLGVVNLVYGFYFSFGALLALWLTQALGLPVWASFLLAVLVSGILAALIDALLLTRLRRARAPELASLMVTLGATLLLYSLSSSLLGVEIRRFPAAAINSSAFDLMGLRVSLTQLLIVLAAFAMVVFSGPCRHGQRCRAQRQQQRRPAPHGCPDRADCPHGLCSTHRIGCRQSGCTCAPCLSGAAARIAPS